MKRTLQQGEYVKYRPAMDRPEQWGRVRKEVHILNERLEQVSVYVTARQYGSLSPGVSYVATVDKLARLAQDVVQGYVGPSLLEPLARAISLQ